MYRKRWMSFISLIEWNVIQLIWADTKFTPIIPVRDSEGSPASSRIESVKTYPHKLWQYHWHKLTVNRWYGKLFRFFRVVCHTTWTFPFKSSFLNSNIHYCHCTEPTNMHNIHILRYVRVCTYKWLWIFSSACSIK